MSDLAEKKADEVLRVHIDEQTCQGLGYCERLCAKVFKVSEDTGLAVVLHPAVGEPLVKSVIHAEESCPTRAISVWFEKTPPKNDRE